MHFQIFCRIFNHSINREMTCSGLIAGLLCSCNAELFQAREVMTPVIRRCALLLLQVQQAGDVNGKFNLPPGEQELVFMGERCRDTASLADYGVSEPWIVAGALAASF